MRRLQSNELHKSIQSLAVIMPTWAEQLFHDQDDTDSVYFRKYINKFLYRMILTFKYII